MDSTNPAATARLIAESLIPPSDRGPDWTTRWECLEVCASPALSDDQVRRAYLDKEGVAGTPVADALATACMIRGVDI